MIKVRAALETALNAITPALATAWENAAYTPVTGAPYQKVEVLAAEPENPTMGDDFYRERGFMQVTLFYPVDGGANAATARAELIREAFYRGRALVKDGVMTTIERKPHIMPGFRDGDRWAVPVRVRWYANIS